jgi:MFS family permease|tara:strand:- start:15762 stop:16967 length:1206 start_codon:yes stop_codon:yes gene_type:complete
VDKNIHKILLKPLVSLNVVTFLVFFSFALQRPFIPVFMEEKLGASILEVGYAASVLGLTGVLLSVPAGFISDRIGRHIPIIAGSFFWAGSLAYMSIATDPLQIILSFAVAGAGTVLFDASISAYVGDISSTDNLGKTYGVFNAAIQAGFAAGPIAGALLIIQMGYRDTFLATAVLPMIAIVIVIATRPHRIGNTTENFIESSLKPTKIYRSGVIWTGWISIFCFSLLLAGVGVLAPLYVRFLGFNEFFIGALFTTQAITGAFGRLPFGRLIDSTQRITRFMEWGLLLMAMSTIGFVLSSDGGWLLLMMAFFGIGFSLAFMSATVNIARGTNVSNRGLAMGFGSMFRFAGFTVGPWLGSLVVSSHDSFNAGFTNGFIVMAAFSLVSIPLLVIIEKYHYRVDD